jgi:hypothetical protein
MFERLYQRLLFHTVWIDRDSAAEVWHDDLAGVHCMQLQVHLYEWLQIKAATEEATNEERRVRHRELDSVSCSSSDATRTAKITALEHQSYLLTPIISPYSDYLS